MNVTIGQGPDYVMKQGKVEMFHTLQLKWYLDGSGAPKNDVIFDRSLFVVTNSFLGKLAKFGNISVNKRRVESDPFVFRFSDGRESCGCIVLINAVHALQNVLRVKVNRVFTRSITEALKNFANS